MAAGCGRRPCTLPDCAARPPTPGSSSTKHPPGPGPPTTSPPHERASRRASGSPSPAPPPALAGAARAGVERALAERRVEPGPVVAHGHADAPPRRRQLERDALAGVPARVVDERRERAAHDLGLALGRAAAPSDADVDASMSARARRGRPLRPRVELAPGDRHQCVDRAVERGPRRRPRRAAPPRARRGPAPVAAERQLGAGPQRRRPACAARGRPRWRSAARAGATPRSAPEAVERGGEAGQLVARRPEVEPPVEVVGAPVLGAGRHLRDRAQRAVERPPRSRGRRRGAPAPASTNEPTSTSCWMRSSGAIAYPDDDRARRRPRAAARHRRRAQAHVAGRVALGARGAGARAHSAARSRRADTPAGRSTTRSPSRTHVLRSSTSSLRSRAPAMPSGVTFSSAS